ncbi:MAG: outer membrane beta-barrel protein [Methylococcales bacterium]|nr:outer membrane beta-barrel protein [Methylococcales bacterium]
MYPLLKPQSAWLIAGLLISASAIADEHKAYVQFNAGAAFATDYKRSESRCYSFGCDSYSSKEDYDPGYVASIALGYRIAEPFRVEFEGLYQGNDRNSYNETFTSGSYYYHNSGKLNGQRERMAFLVNGYYDFKNSSAFTPFLTGGLGGYHLSLKSNNVDLSNDLDFAWQVGAGVNYKLDDRISFDLKYRYFGGADTTLSPDSSTFSGVHYSVGDHQAVAGIRIGF